MKIGQNILVVIYIKSLNDVRETNFKLEYTINLVPLFVD